MEQLNWLEENMGRIIHIEVTANPAQTRMVLNTMREASRRCLQSTLIEFVLRQHDLRQPDPLGKAAQAWIWAERCALEVAGSRLTGWSEALYWRELHALTTRYSVLLNVTAEHIGGYKARELVVVAVCFGELLKVYEREPDVFWRLHQRRSEALGYLSIKLPAWGAELN